MNDFMTWLYEHYIEPEIRLQPKDDGDTFRFSLMESAAAPQETPVPTQDQPPEGIPLL